MLVSNHALNHIALVVVLLLFFASFVHGYSDQTRSEKAGNQEAPLFFDLSVNNYVLYTIIQKSKEELQQEDHEDGSEGESVVMRVTRKTLSKYGYVYQAVVNSRIAKLFMSKIYRMESLLKKCSGGRQLGKLLESWKNGKGSVWKIKIFYSEVDTAKLLEMGNIDHLRKENHDLKQRKRKAEDNLMSKQQKCAKLEKRLNKASSQAKSSKAALKRMKERFKKMAKKLIQQQRELTGKGRGPSKKMFHQYSRQHQAVIKKNFITDSQIVLSFLNLYSFAATRVDIRNEETGVVESLSLLDEHDIPVNQKEQSISGEELEKVNMLLYAKERFNISNGAFHEMSMLMKEMPRSRKFTQRTKELNKLWNIFPTPPGTVGVQQKLEDRLKVRLSQLIGEKGSLNEAGKVRIKISGDGTNLGKRLHVVNVTFTLLDEGQLAQSERGNHLLAILKEPEHYNEMALGLSDLLEEIRNLKYIVLDGCRFQIEYFLGGDWKFLAMCVGIDAAISEYACVWCKCPATERCNIQKSWSITDPRKGARTIQEITELARMKKTKTVKNYNCSRQPHFPMLPIDHVIIDTLHLFLRISDNLINLLILELRRQDAIDKIQTFNSGFNRSRYKHMVSYEKFLNDECSIGFSWYICKDSKKLKWRDLTGPEKVKLFNLINISTLLPNFNKSSTTQKIWDGFASIMDNLKELSGGEEVGAFKCKVQDWITTFLSVYQGKHVTPYMHALVAHVPEFISVHGNIVSFTQQGLEKFNDATTKNYFQASNHRNTEALLQIMQKNNRMEHYIDHGYAREKRSFSCSNCGLPGHNLKTCTQPCDTCAFKPCCSPCHLVKTEGIWKKHCLNN